MGKFHPWLLHSYHSNVVLVFEISYISTVKREDKPQELDGFISPKHFHKACNEDTADENVLSFGVSRHLHFGAIHRYR